MFGHHKMTHGGTAKVVTCEVHIGPSGNVGLKNKSGWDWIPYDFILEVTPEGGASLFRAAVRKHFGSGHHPDVGDTIKVRCNPEKQAVEIDVSEDKRFNRKLYGSDKKHERKEHEADLDRILHAPPGTPVESASDDRFGGLQQRIARLTGELDDLPPE